MKLICEILLYTQYYKKLHMLVEHIVEKIQQDSKSSMLWKIILFVHNYSFFILAVLPVR